MANSGPIEFLATKQFRDHLMPVRAVFDNIRVNSSAEEDLEMPEPGTDGYYLLSREVWNRACQAGLNEALAAWRATSPHIASLTATDFLSTFRACVFHPVLAAAISPQRSWNDDTWSVHIDAFVSTLAATSRRTQSAEMRFAAPLHPLQFRDAQLIWKTDDHSVAIYSSPAEALQGDEYPPSEEWKRANPDYYALGIRAKAFGESPLTLRSTFIGSRRAHKRFLRHVLRAMRTLMRVTDMTGHWFMCPPEVVNKHGGINESSISEMFADRVRLLRQSLQILLEPTSRKGQMAHRIRNAMLFLMDADSQRSATVTLALSWAAIESLVGSSSDESVRRALAERAATILNADCSKREQAIRIVKKMYDVRCDIVHGKRSLDEEESAFDARTLAAGVLKAALLREELFRRTYGDIESDHAFFADLALALANAKSIDGIPEWEGLWSCIPGMQP
ncbi:MAG: hypothetical protein AMXMBFR58_21860 [Phycisphaerae bacterium]